MSEPAAHPARTALVIGFVPGVSPDKWARVWAERMPHLPLDLRPVEDDRALELLAGDLDMVLARDAPASDELNAIALWTETPVVAVAKDHPIKLFDAVTLADLVDENQLEGAGVDVLDLVAAGVGVARMPQSVLRATGRRDVVGRPVSDAEPTRISLVWPRDSDDEAIEEFVGIVRGRTANSSRGSGETRPREKPAPARPQQRKSVKPARARSKGRRR